MKANKIILCCILAGLGLAAGHLRAATYATGDLLLGFVAQNNPGSTQTLVVNLGPASDYRDYYDSGTSQFNIKSIGSQLTSTFGSTWYDRTDLYMSVFATTSSSALGNGLLDGDPNRTLYVSRTRNTSGLATPGMSASSTWVVGSDGIMTSTSNNITATAGRYQLSGADGDGVAIIDDSAANTLDEFTRPTTSVSFGGFNGGIEFKFGAGSYGTFTTSPVGTVEGALDFYRLQARNDITGQYGEGSSIRRGDYSGAFTIDQSGQVSFIPEAGSTALLGLGALLGISRRRRTN